jgi:hypothetical protein
MHPYDKEQQSFLPMKFSPAHIYQATFGRHSQTVDFMTGVVTGPVQRRLPTPGPRERKLTTPQ